MNKVKNVNHLVTKFDLERLRRQLKSDLTLRVGVMMAVTVLILAAVIKV